VGFSNLSGINFSTLADNYVVLNVSGDVDIVFENDRKTEAVIIIMEQYKASLGRDIQPNFSDNVTYKVKTGQRTLKFEKNESASGVPKLKKNMTALTVGIATGLPRETDSTPPNLSQALAGGRGGGGGGRGGGGRGAARGGGRAAPSAQQSNGPASGGGVPAGGGGAPAGGGRGGPGRGGRGAGGNPAGGAGGPGGGRGAGGGRGGRALPTPGGQQQAPREPPKPKAKALYEYGAQTQDELSFSEGDVIEIIRKDPGGWWEGEMNGKRGWIPANYVEEF